MTSAPRTVTIAALPLLLGGCFTTATFTRTGDQRLAPRPKDCSFAVYTAVPPAGSAELGLVVFHDSLPITLEDARTAAAPHVCSAGGDGLIIPPPSEGAAIPRATIIKVPAKPGPTDAPPVLDQRP